MAQRTLSLADPFKFSTDMLKFLATHINDTIEVCYEAWKKNKCRHYSISNKKTYSILEVAKLFKSKIKYLPARAGERYGSALTNMSLNNKVQKRFGKIHLKNYISSFIKKENK